MAAKKNRERAIRRPWLRGPFQILLRGIIPEATMARDAFSSRAGARPARHSGKHWISGVAPCLRACPPHESSPPNREERSVGPFSRSLLARRRVRRNRSPVLPLGNDAIAKPVAARAAGGKMFVHERSLLWRDFIFGRGSQLRERIGQLAERAAIGIDRIRKTAQSRDARRLRARRDRFRPIASKAAECRAARVRAKGASTPPLSRTSPKSVCWLLTTLTEMKARFSRSRDCRRSEIRRCPPGPRTAAPCGSACRTKAAACRASSPSERRFRNAVAVPREARETPRRCRR